MLQLKLHTGSTIPAIGFGCAGWGEPATANAETYRCKLESAYKAGYRFYDCAYKYGTEERVGEFGAAHREDTYLLTKYMEYEEGDTVDTVLAGMRQCVRRMCPGMEKPCVDLFLIHEPTVGQRGREILWEALAELQRLGETKDIGVSNFGVKHLKTLPLPKPVVNQVELHPWCQHRPVLEYCRENGIIMQGYAPNARNKMSNDPTLVKIAKANNRTPTQILLRWSVQNGFIPLPKSDDPNRMASNISVFDFELSAEHMTLLNDLGSEGDKPVCKTYDDYCD